MIFLVCLDLRDPCAYYDRLGNRYLLHSHAQFVRVHNLLTMQALYKR